MVLECGMWVGALVLPATSLLQSLAAEVLSLALRQQPKEGGSGDVSTVAVSVPPFFDQPDVVCRRREDRVSQSPGRMAPQRHMTGASPVPFPHCS